MYKIIGNYRDRKCFGDQVFIYKSEDNFLVILTDRGELAYFVVDFEMEKMYPINTYMKNNGLCFDINNAVDHINIAIDIDFSKYGYTKCPDYLNAIIKKSQR